MSDVPNSREAVRRFIHERCVRIAGPNDELFELNGGGRSNLYINLRPLFGSPRLMRMVVPLVLTRLPWPCRTLAGVPTGGLLLAQALITQLPNDNQVIWVPKPKGHGLPRTVEAEPNPGAATLMLEDTLATGKQVRADTTILRDAGWAVQQALCLVEREECGGRANLAADNLALDALFTTKDICPQLQVIYLPPDVTP